MPGRRVRLHLFPSAFEAARPTRDTNRPRPPGVNSDGGRRVMRCGRCGSPVDERAERCAACGEDLVLVILGVDQTPGDPSSPPGRPAPWRGMALTAVAVVVGALWLSQGGSRSPTASPTRSPPSSLPGEAPMRFGRIFICPFGTPYQAYGSGRAY